MSRIKVNEKRGKWINTANNESYIIHSSDNELSAVENSRLMKLTQDFNLEKADITICDTHISYSYKIDYKHIRFIATVYLCSDNAPNFVGFTFHYGKQNKLNN